MAEQGCLLSSCRGNSTEGSNPSLSASPENLSLRLSSSASPAIAKNPSRRLGFLAKSIRPVASRPTRSR